MQYSAAVPFVLLAEVAIETGRTKLETGNSSEKHSTNKMTMISTKYKPKRKRLRYVTNAF